MTSLWRENKLSEPTCFKTKMTFFSLFVFLLFFIGSSLSDTLSKRGLPLPRGISTSASHYGSRFCVSFPSSSKDSSLSLHFTTPEPDPVSLEIYHYSTNVTNRVTINGGVLEYYLESPSLSTLLPTDPPYGNRTTIKSDNSSHLFSVVAVIRSNERTSTFLVLPENPLPFVTEYRYTHFSLPRDAIDNNDYSMFIISSCFGRVAPFALAPESLAGKVHVRDVYNLFGSTLTTVQDYPTPLRVLDETFHFENSSLDMTGVSVYGSSPISFVASQVCKDGDECNEVAEQIPPSYSWGYLFYLMHFDGSRNHSYGVRIRPRHNETLVTYRCHDNKTSVIVTTEGLDFPVDAEGVCTIKAERPVAVVQYYIEEGFTTMVWIPSVSQYLRKHYIGPLLDGFSHYITVTVDSDCFNVSRIMIGGSPVSFFEHVIYSVEMDDVSGYGIVMPVHFVDPVGYVEHVDDGCTINVVGYGWGNVTGYAHATGYGLEPIGIPIVSVVVADYVLTEGDNISISVTRGGDILTDVSVRFELHNGDCDQPGSLAAGDFITTSGTFNITSNVTVTRVVLSSIEETVLEQTKTFCFILLSAGDEVYIPVNRTSVDLIDDDLLLLGFESSSITIREDIRQFPIRLRSSIPVSGNGLRIRLVANDGTATVGEDFNSFDVRTTLQPGLSSWHFNLDIINNRVSEPTKHFGISLSLLTVIPNARLSNAQLNVTIIDDDSVSFSFSRSDYSVPENGGSIVLNVLKEGTTVQPLSIFIESFDITAYAGSDYTPINRRELTFLNESSKSVVVFIHNDSFLEASEIFGIRLTTVQSQVIITQPTVNVTIENDDNVTVGLASSDLQTFENIGLINVTILIAGLVSYRDFYVHFGTTEDSAKEFSDFIPVNRDILFPANTTSVSVFINITNNEVTESDSESFTISLSNSQNDLSFVTIRRGGGEASVVINDDDKTFIKFVDNITYVGQEGGEPVKVQLVKTGNTDGEVSVFIIQDPGSAGDDDYSLEGGGVVSFKQDEFEKTISVTLHKDTETEGREEIKLALIPGNALVDVDLNQVITIGILDSTVIVLSFTARQFIAMEGQTAAATVSVIGGSRDRGNITLGFNVTFGNATAPDMRDSPGAKTYSVPPGVTNFTFRHSLVDDRLFEGPETFRVELFAADNVTEISGNRSALIVIEDNDNVTFNFKKSNVSVMEGEGTIDLEIEKIGLTSLDIPLLITYYNESALGGSDYNSTPAVLLFKSNSSTAIVSVQILDDNIVEERIESFIIEVSSILDYRGISFDNNSTRINIIDDDVLRVSFSNAVYNGSEDVGVVNITIDVFGSTDLPLMVTISTTNGVAKAPGDFSPVNKSLLLSGDRIIEPITITQDRNVEVQETFFVNLTSNSDLVQLERRDAVVFIDDSVVPGRLLMGVQAPAGMNVSEDNGFFSFNYYIIFGMLERSIFLNVTTVGFTATGGEDFDSTLQLIEMLPGERIKIVHVRIVDDRIAEGPETFRVVTNLAEKSVLILQSSFNVTITDDDENNTVFSNLSFSSGNYEVPENSRRVNITVVASRPVPSDTVIRLTDIPQPGQASNVTDYASNFTTITIPSGQRSASFIATIFDDETPEPTETFMVGMSIVSGSMVAVSTRDSRTTVTITDSDRSTIRYAPDRIERFEEDGLVPLRIIVDPPYFETFMFEMFSEPFEDGNDLAISDTDYESFRRTLTATNGAGPIDSSVTLIDDSIMEDTEEFGIRLNVTSNVRVDVHSSVDSAKVVIKDIRDRISVGFREPRYVFTEPETQVTVVEIQADVRGIVAKQFSCNVEYTDGTAIGGGEDYDEGGQTSISTLFPVGTNTSTVIRVTLYPDDLDEFTEEFTATLKDSDDFAADRIDFFRQDTIIEIIDSDVVDFYVNTSLSTTNVPESQNAEICVQRSGRTVRNYTLNLQPSTIPGGAQSSDFSTAPISFVFRPGDTTICRSVPVVDDTIALEGNETFVVNLTSTTPGFMTTTPSVSIIIRDNDVPPVCTLQSLSVVFPFPSRSLSYRYHSNCEHVVLRRCGLTSSFLLTVLYEGPTIERVGLKVDNKMVIVFKNLTLISENLGNPMRPSEGVVKYETKELIVTQSGSLITLLLNMTKLSVEISRNETRDLTLSVTSLDGGRGIGGDTCGLCGGLTGKLLHSNEEDRLVLSSGSVPPVEGAEVDDFVKSWLVNPGERLLVTGDKPECGLFVNDTVIGDPLFRVPLPPFALGTSRTHLCYEILGRRSDAFNLISDRCLSVNALYSPMNDPRNGNVIGSIGITSVDNLGRCIRVTISHSVDGICTLLVNGVEQSRYDEGAGIVVVKRSGRVRVGVANCNKEGVVMWVMCDVVRGQKMIDFVVSRGANLSPTSHGLLGQFWNIPITVRQYQLQEQLNNDLLEDFNPNQLYIVKVSPPGQAPREFVGEMYRRSWDRSMKPCLYVGSSQGSRMSDIPGPIGTVIEGSYLDYLVPGLLASDFKFSKFQNSFCRQ